MQHIEGTFRGVRDLAIYHQSWLPSGDPQAVILIVHGLGEHSGRYSYVAEYYAARGYAVHALDHPGHGKSDGTRVYVERFADLTDNLAIYYALVAQRHPGKPIFLLGHSMGGLVGVTYMPEHQADFAGAIFSGPSVAVGKGISPALVAMAKVLSVLTPKLKLTTLDVNAISRDPAVVQACLDDPLNSNGKVSARLGAEMLKTMQDLPSEMSKITLPFLIVQGSADHLADQSGARMLYDRAGSQDKTLKIYDGLYHEVFSEPEKDAVLADVENWLAAHLPGAARRQPEITTPTESLQTA